MSDEKLDEILRETIRIRTALWPDEGQPSLITKHGERLDNLEGWRNYLVGAWAVISTFVSIHILGRHGG